MKLRNEDGTDGTDFPISNIEQSTVISSTSIQISLIILFLTNCVHNQTNHQQRNSHTAFIKTFI